jgi:dynein heavy chain
VVIKNYLKTLDAERFTNLSLNFSSSTKSIDLYNNLVVENLEKDSGLQYKPKSNKILACWIDDMSMPKKDPYNTQQVIAFMKFFIENG